MDILDMMAIVICGFVGMMVVVGVIAIVADFLGIR